MPIVRITSDSIEPIEATTLSAAGLRERTDLQRLLKKNIRVIDPDLLVIDEEFGQWEDSRRRIDLLAVDRVREKRRQSSRSARPQSTPEEILARLAPADRAVAEELCRWIESYEPRWKAGSAGFSPILTIGGSDRRFFRIRKDGALVVRFDSLTQSPPFDAEEMREELRRRLNSIDDVAIDRIRGKPNLALAALAKPDAMRALQDAFAWAIDEVRRSASTTS